MLIIPVWGPILRSTGISIVSAKQMECVCHIKSDEKHTELFGIKIGNVFLLKVSRKNALFLEMILKFYSDFF